MNPKRLLPFAVPFAAALVVIAGWTAGCWWHSSTEPESRDSITVSSIAPPNGSRLAPGSSVTFTVSVDYRLRSDGFLADDRGTISMDIEDQDGRNLDVEVTKRVGNGQGSTSLSDRVAVPRIGVSQVRVVVALIPDAVNAPTVESVAGTYPVGH